jgi:hypothetical protein
LHTKAIVSCGIRLINFTQEVIQKYIQGFSLKGLLQALQDTAKPCAQDFQALA